jgi:two-component system OmpR family sensor kinase
MLTGLRSKLIAAFAFIIFVCLFSAGTAFVLFLRNHETEMARERVGRLAQPLADRVTYLEWVGVTPDQMKESLVDYANNMDVRVLIVDKATSRVVIDTSDRLEGQTLEDLQRSDVGTEKVGPIWVWQIHFRGAGENLVLFTPLERVPATEAPSASLLSRYQTVVAVPEEDITSAWLDVLPQLGVAGSISLGISVVVAFLLSRSISGPLRQITRASEAMARGKYDQQIDVRGRDEVGRLASSFNSMAREVDRSQSTLRQFLADASHELRTPLTSIQGFSQAMAEGTIDTPEGLAESARIINDEAQRMRGLVDDLLELSRIEGGQAAMQKEPLDLADLLRTTVERFERRAQEKSLDLQVEVPELPSMEGDVRRLEQALANLVDNAVRHTPRDGTVAVRAQVVDATVRVAVQNSGSLIPAEDLPHLFERFYQVENSGGKEGHSGLGLAIASEVVHAHGGTITAKSSKEEGTEFTVTLPLG